jgi:hypothetical protein
LPTISVTYSIMAVVGITAYLGQSIAQSIMSSVMVFLVSNIPTIILIAIYLACREKFKKKKEIERMNIHDLE